MVGTRYFASATNGWYSIWYHNYERTWSITSLPGFFAEGEWFLSFWHRQKAVFLCFLFQCPQYLSSEPCQPFLYNRPKEPSLWFVGGGGGIKKASFERRLLVTPEGLEPSTHWLRVNCSTNWATESWCLFVSELRVQSYDIFWNLQKKICVFFKKSAFFVVFLVFSPSCASVLCVFGPKFG